jgi:hypothetical protein
MIEPGLHSVDQDTSINNDHAGVAQKGWIVVEKFTALRAHANASRPRAGLSLSLRTADS